MRAYSLSNLGDHELLHALATLVARDRVTTAALLAHLAEVDARRLYLPAAYPSMFSYCVHELHLSEDATYKRIQAARVARQFPAIFELLAHGRLHLTAVLLLASYLTAENAEELLAAAAHRTKPELERLLAERFPRPELPPRVEVVAAAPSSTSLRAQLAPERVDPPGPGPVAPGSPPRAAPLSPQRYALQLTIAQDTYDDLRYAQALLGHPLPSGDLAAVVGRALKALIGQLEKTKFAATPRPRRSGRPSAHPRHIPAQVKRAVWERDGGQCSFVSQAGAAARRARGWSSITSRRWRAAAGPRWRGCGCVAGPTTNMEWSARSEPSSCATSAQRRGVRRKLGGRRPTCGRRTRRGARRWASSAAGVARSRATGEVRARIRSRSPRPRRGHGLPRT